MLISNRCVPKLVILVAFIAPVFGGWNRLPGGAMLNGAGNAVHEPVGDLNGDGDIDLADLVILSSEWLMPGTVADLDGDGKVDMPDLAILASHWQQNPWINLRSSEVLTRSSIAFLDGVQYAADTPRNRILPIPTVPTMTQYATEMVGAEGAIPLAVQCISGGYLYACKSGALGLNSGIFRSSDGITWTVMAPSASINVLRIFPVNNGDILVVRVIGITARDLFYSTDGGATLRAATNGGLPFTFTNLSEPSAPSSWNYHQRADNGTMIISEYSTNVDKAPRMYRSTDNGRTWTEVYNFTTAIGPGRMKHYHAVSYHAGTGKWVSVIGDNGTVLNGGILTSGDDGVTWAQSMPQHTRYCQPVRFWDVGHATKILAADDAGANVSWLDLSSFEVEPLIPDAHVSFNRYSFNLFHHQGIYFADRQSSASLTNTLRRAGIYVSTDLVTWAPYYLFRDKEVGVLNFLGVMGNQLHFTVEQDGHVFEHYSLTIPTVSFVQGVCVDPATTNLLKDASKSSAESNVTGFSGGLGTVVQSSDFALNGNYSAKFQTPYSSGAYIRFPTPGAGTDAWYSGRFAARAGAIDNTDSWQIRGTHGAAGVTNGATIWAPSTVYTVGVYVTNGGGLYWCLADHTSGVFSDDLKAKLWAEMGDGYIAPAIQKWTQFVSRPWNPGISTNYLRAYAASCGGYLGIAGTHTAVAESATVLTDETKNWVTNELVGFSVVNVTDSPAKAYSIGTITANTATTLTVSSLSGGLDNKFQPNDTYRIMGSLTYLDCGQIEQGICSRWQIGGTPRMHEKITMSHAYPATWSQVMTICPESNSDCQFKLGNQYLFTMYKDSNNGISVYYNPADGKFYLETRNGGSSAMTATANAYFYYQDQPIRIGVRFDGTRLLFSVSCGDAWEHVTDVAAFPWCAELTACKTGNYDDSKVLSMTLMESWLKNKAVSNSELEMSP
jgi:hypothetical protein